MASGRWPYQPLAANQVKPPYPGQDWPRGVPADQGTNPGQPYSNPTGSVPGPRTPPNLGYWSGDKTTLTMTATIDTDLGWSDGVVARTSWQSTVLDLSPQLRASASYSPVAQPIMAPSGYAQKEEARMQIEFERIDAITSMPGRFEVRYMEFGSTTTPEALRRLNAPQDVTPSFYSAGHNDAGVIIAPGMELVFRAPGHLRYWGVLLVIDLVSGVLPADIRFPWTVRGVAQ